MFASVTPAGALIFRPRPSHTWRGPIFGAAAFLLAALLLVALSGFIPAVVVIVDGIIACVLALFMLGLAYFFWRATTTMRYEISDDTLTLVGGPVRYVIPLASIKRVYSRDINTGYRNRTHVARATAVNVPGLALSNVVWKDTGLLKMCATSSWRNIMIIETDTNTYGITPADDQAFLSALSEAGVKFDAQHGDAQSDTSFAFDTQPHID